MVKMVNVSLEKSWWIDALGYVVQIRRNAIPEILTHLESITTTESRTTAPIFHLFRMVVRYACQMGFADVYSGSRFSKHWARLQTCFVDPMTQVKDLLLVPLFLNVKPTQANRFLFHVLLF